MGDSFTQTKAELCVKIWRKIRWRTGLICGSNRGLGYSLQAVEAVSVYVWRRRFFRKREREFASAYYQFRHDITREPPAIHLPQKTVFCVRAHSPDMRSSKRRTAESSTGISSRAQNLHRRLLQSLSLGKRSLLSLSLHLLSLWSLSSYHLLTLWPPSYASMAICSEFGLLWLCYLLKDPFMRNENLLNCLWVGIPIGDFDWGIACPHRNRILVFKFLVLTKLHLNRLDDGKKNELHFPNIEAQRQALRCISSYLDCLLEDASSRVLLQVLCLVNTIFQFSRNTGIFFSVLIRNTLICFHMTSSPFRVQLLILLGRWFQL